MRPVLLESMGMVSERVLMCAEGGVIREIVEAAARSRSEASGLDTESTFDLDRSTERKPFRESDAAADES